jgi:hypothetical protein
LSHHGGNDRADPNRQRATWRVGQRECPARTAKSGTVTGINGKIEVEWDGGRTSYLRHGERGNIEAAHEAVKTREQNHVHSRRAIGRSRVDA